MNRKILQPLKPKQYAEDKLIIYILDNIYPSGSHLPSERDLAKKIGVTRPTLREALHCLAQEKWLTIHHGKKTVVNDYWKEGGLGMLSTMARYVDRLPGDFIPNLLEFRTMLLPGCADISVRKAPEKFLQHLKKKSELKDDAGDFTAFDWTLQHLMVSNQSNRIYLMILNDFCEIYQRLGQFYFNIEKAREISRNYYESLEEDIVSGGKNSEFIVRTVMEESSAIWINLTALGKQADETE